MSTCWIYYGADLHPTFMAWKDDVTSSYSFDLPHDSGAPLFTRHHPYRCEMLRSDPGTHLQCCRPSHLRWGNRSANESDKGFRKRLEKTEAYRAACAAFWASIDTAAYQLVQGEKEDGKKKQSIF